MSKNKSKASKIEVSTDNKPKVVEPIKNSDLAEKYLLVGIQNVNQLAEQILKDQIAHGFKNKDGEIANLKGNAITLENLKREVGHVLYDVKKEKGRWAKFKFVETFEGKQIEPREA